MKIYNNDFREVKVLGRLNCFNEFLNGKVIQIQEYLSKNEYLKEQLRWLKKWDKVDRIGKMESIKKAINFGQVETKKFDIIFELIDSYTKYFKVIDEEDCEQAKYEEMFRTIIEIPDELINALDIKDFKISFDSGRYYNSESQINIELNLRSELPLAG
ncbi:hypothetical protein [Clostridium sp.]|uniref:hypothetical protein n=1 Tax=Clostridium sp. TaxID=1506 RepID=UPI0035A187D3